MCAAEPWVETWLVQEPCSGGTLVQALQAGRFKPRGGSNQLDLEAVMATTQDIAAALACLHARDLQHGNLTTDWYVCSALVTARDSAKLACCNEHHQLDAFMATTQDIAATLARLHMQDLLHEKCTASSQQPGALCCLPWQRYGSWVDETQGSSSALNGQLPGHCSRSSLLARARSAAQQPDWCIFAAYEVLAAASVIKYEAEHVLSWQSACLGAGRVSCFFGGGGGDAPLQMPALGRCSWFFVVHCTSAEAASPALLTHGIKAAHKARATCHGSFLRSARTEPQPGRAAAAHGCALASCGLDRPTTHLLPHEARSSWLSLAAAPGSSRTLL